MSLKPESVEKKHNANELDSLGDGHHVNSTEAIRLGRDVWCRGPSQTGSRSQPSGTTDRAGQLWNEEQVKLSLKSAVELSLWVSFGLEWYPKLLGLSLTSHELHSWQPVFKVHSCKVAGTISPLRQQVRLRFP